MLFGLWAYHFGCSHKYWKSIPLHRLLNHSIHHNITWHTLKSIQNHVKDQVISNSHNQFVGEQATHRFPAYFLEVTNNRKWNKKQKAKSCDMTNKIAHDAKCQVLYIILQCTYGRSCMKSHPYVLYVWTVPSHSGWRDQYWRRIHQPNLSVRMAHFHVNGSHAKDR
jgi:hypothetical protein